MVRKPGARFYHAAVKALAAIGLLFLLVTFTPFVSWYATRLSRPWAPYEGDVLIVLSAAVPNSGVMDTSTYWRCYQALLYYREHPYREIIVTGKDSAPGMRDFFVFNGVPAERIRVENSATNTRENAEFTARMLAGERGRIVLVTSDSHMFRARRCFAALGIPVSASAVPDVVKRADHPVLRPELFASEVQETAGILYYWYRGWIRLW
jgi:uncharacterized SAM-binding protein YcdF (DUF218 family)